MKLLIKQLLMEGLNEENINEFGISFVNFSGDNMVGRIANENKELFTNLINTISDQHPNVHKSMIINVIKEILNNHIKISQ